MQLRVLIVEDHPDIVEIVRYNLEREGFQVSWAKDGEEGLKKIMAERPDLLLLDLMLPKMSGFDVCKTLRSEVGTRSLPVVMLTAKGEEVDIVRGLELGADDYVTKPFKPKELLARVRAVLRRSDAKTDVIRFRDLVIDSDRHRVDLKGEELQLTRAEFRLLRALASRQGRVFTRDQLIEKMTGGDVSIVDRNIDVHVSSLRKKLGSYGDLIVTVRGVGYRFAE
ncbi:MAG: response regulator [Pseudomonadota bacterium]